MAIMRGKFTVIIMFDTDEIPANEILGMDVEALLDETARGVAIGGLEGGFLLEEVPADKVVPALLEIGNDGTFFDRDED